MTCLPTITKGAFLDHLSKVETVLEINISKSSFGTQELEHLGYLLMPMGIKPIAKKMVSILRIQPPNTVRQLWRLLGMVNYYRDMWKRRSHILAPLSALTKQSPKKKLIWGPEQQKAFEDMKKAIRDSRRHVVFSNFTKPFAIHTDARQ